jgi:hypothetical protein
MIWFVLLHVLTILVCAPLMVLIEVLKTRKAHYTFDMGDLLVGMFYSMVPALNIIVTSIVVVDHTDCINHINRKLTDLIRPGKDPIL